MTVRWLVRKPSPQTCLSDDFMWKMRRWIYRSISIVFTIDATRANALRTTRFRSSLIHKKHFAKKEASQKRYRLPFSDRPRTTSCWNPRRKPAPTNLDSQSIPAMSSAEASRSRSACGDVPPNVVHEQALSSEHRASEVERCESWFSIRNDRYSSTDSNCITFRKRKTANLWDDPWYMWGFLLPPAIDVCVAMESGQTWKVARACPC